MELAVYGAGAAGNKAVIKLIEEGIIKSSNAKLLNTTSKDIPEKYKKDGNLVCKFDSELGGCGKEPIKGKKAMLKALSLGSVELLDILPDTKDREIVIVTSTEGGTGSGSTPELIKYLLDNVGAPIHVFAFIGFNDDPRGIKNTLLFFKSLDENITLHTIKNDEFLDYTNNHELAESRANDYFVNQIEILRGSKMIPSDQNIDDTDMYKVTTTKGYMDIKHIDLTGIKNIDTFNKAIVNAYENEEKGLEFEPSAKRIAVFINASDKTRLAIDGNLQVVKRYVGESFAEFYKHIQYDDTTEEYIDIIAGGLKYPRDAIMNINKSYTEVKNKMNTKHDSLKDIFDDIDLDEDDDEFDINIHPIGKNASRVDKTISSDEY